MTNITLRRVCAALAVLLTVSMLFNCTVSKKNVALTEENNWYDYQYIHAYNAMETVAEYCDSTADTGEMDDFIQSDNGQFFWSEFDKVNENQ